MKKFAFILLAVCLLLATGCSTGDTADTSPENGSLSAEVYEESYESVEDILKRIMPEQMEDGEVKIAVIRNLSESDHTRLYLSGCITEGVLLGFKVDTFVTDGNNERCLEIISQVIAAEYDGIILSHCGYYTYDVLLPAVEKGVKVVTFDSVPYKRGKILEGCTSTSQEDFKLANLSLSALVGYFAENDRPIRVIRTWMGPDIAPMDNRKAIFDQFVAEGKIVEVAVIDPADYSDPRGGAKDAMSSLLSQLPEGGADAVWGCYDELAKGCLDALKEANRADIKIFSIDISDVDINLMLENQEIWISTAAVDPRLIGISNIRLLAAKFANEVTPDVYKLDAQLVETRLLDSTINMTNIANVVADWGQERGVFDHYLWIEQLKKITYRY